MKNLKFLFTFLFTASLIIVGCKEDDASIGDIIAPSNIQVTAEIIGVDVDNPNGDGSGMVKFTFSADNALSYNLQFGDGMTQVANSGEVTHRYTNTGLNTYVAVVNAVGTGGVTSNMAIEVTVFSSFDDPEAKELLSGGEGNSKIWYVAVAEIGHLGVGPTAGVTNYYPEYYAAPPFAKCDEEISSCFCDDELTFALDTTGHLTYQLNNNGQTFFNGAHQGVIGQNAGEDACFDFDTAGINNVTLAPSDSDWSLVQDPAFEARGTQLNFANNAFMSYYVGSSSYEILELTENTLYVRTIDGLDAGLAWYLKFTTSPPTEDFTTIYNTLLWEDNFEVNGAPNSANWTYDLGAGGWGNGELQTYTNNAENVIVQDGFLKITAKAQGSSYTSARIKSENLREFTYGRVEVRAKLPAGIGSWPAIWMLGADYDINPWPGCGEIDIMEQTGQDKNTTLGTLHYPGVSPGGGNSGNTAVLTSTTEFHNYTVEWTPNVIKFLVDDTVFHTYANTSSTPFNHDFFLILNVAMGGSLGGTVDPGFTQSSMEIDYVRVYQ